MTGDYLHDRGERGIRDWKLQPSVAASHHTSHSTDWKMEVFREMQIQSFAFLFGGLRLVSKVPKVRYELYTEIENNNKNIKIICKFTYSG